MRVVLVLGGGGAKAIAHLGAWKAVVEAGAEVVEVVGTSMGAVMGAALAQGISPDQVLATARSLGPKDVATLDRLSLIKGLFATNLLKPEALRNTIARLAPAKTFAELRIPLTVTATDIDSGELMLFGARGRSPAPLHEVLYASCALPLYFPPAVIAGRRLSDGGLRAVLPLAVAATIPADVVVAVHVGSGFDEAPPPPSASHRLPPPLLRAHDSAVRILMAAQTERAIEAWPKHAPRLVVVRPVAERGATFAVGQSERYFSAGYEETVRRLDG